VAAGRSIFGLFPATEASRREYQQWVDAGRPAIANREKTSREKTS